MNLIMSWVVVGLTGAFHAAGADCPPIPVPLLPAHDLDRLKQLLERYRPGPELAPAPVPVGPKAPTLIPLTLLDPYAAAQLIGKSTNARDVFVVVVPGESALIVYTKPRGLQRVAELLRECGEPVPGP
jgi:hypothetical protein